MHYICIATFASNSSLLGQVACTPWHFHATVFIMRALELTSVINLQPN
jgi:hypothetical protein